MSRPRKKETELAFRLTPHQVRTLAARLHKTRPQSGATLRLRTVADEVSAVELDLEETGDGQPTDERRPIEEVLEALGAQVPQEEWDKLPADLTDHLDHYLYGLPKRTP